MTFLPVKSFMTLSKKKTFFVCNKTFSVLTFLYKKVHNLKKKSNSRLVNSLSNMKGYTEKHVEKKKV